MTLSQWLPLWLQSYKLGTIKGTSYHQLEILCRHIPDDLKVLALPDILPMHLQSFFNAFAQTASKSYMDKMRVLIHSLFADALDNGLIEKDPSKRLRIPRVAERPRKAFTMEEVKSIISYIMACPDAKMGTVVLTLLLTGLRRGDHLGLKWSDLTDDPLTVNRAVYMDQGRPCVQEHVAKTSGSLRTIPLLPELAYRLYALPKTGPYVFGTKNGTLMSPRNFSRDYVRFFRMMQEAEPDVPLLSPHCSRHTIAALSLAAGANLRTVQQLLGHTSIQTTARYAPPDMQVMRTAVEELKAAISALR